jgi:predicted nucleic acid-binding protein
LIRINQTNFILTPVYLEFVGGVTDRHEMELAKAFLDVFRILDEGDIRPEDWLGARRLAERIPTNARRRGTTDCLIKAIAIRLRCEVLTDDAGMPHYP